MLMNPELQMMFSNIDSKIAQDIILPLDAFVRSIGINRNNPHSVFLGAGASISSGIPSAEMCIWEWKRDIFLTNNPGLEDQFSELSLLSVRNRIQEWLDRQGIYPKLKSPDEYSFYIESCFHISEDRRVYFEQKVKKARPQIGYKLLCLLAENQIVQSVWTTNFDNLVSRTAKDFDVIPIEVGIDCQSRLNRTPQREELLCVSLHGDYRYDQLKNTSEEIQAQEQKIKLNLIKRINNDPLIVCGYSGRDSSILEAFDTGVSQKGNGTLYWCGLSDELENNQVQKLIVKAREKDRAAFYVPTNGFDDLFRRLALYCHKDKNLEKAKKIIQRTNSKSQIESARFYVPELKVKNIIKSNAFRIECPSEVFEFGIKSWPDHGRWKWLEQLTINENLIAVPFKQRILSLGSIESIKKAFGDNLVEPISRIPISERDLRYEDTVVVHLLIKALTISVANKIDLDNDKKRMIWEKKSYKKDKIENEYYFSHKAVILSLRQTGREHYLILKPSIKVKNNSGEFAPKHIEKNVKLNVFGYQHNKIFNQEIEHWRNLLFSTEPIFNYPSEENPLFKFRINKVPVFAEVGLSNEGRAYATKPSFQRHIKHKGILLKEPRLVFSNKAANKIAYDTHPIRGMILNQPYDYPLTHQNIIQNNIRVGIVSPKMEAYDLKNYLFEIYRNHRPIHTQLDYLLDFPGFENAYGSHIEIPQTGSDRWSYCPDIDNSLNEKKGLHELARRIIQSINAINAASASNILIIYIPTRWNKWTRYETEDESFDLHDYIKAYCIQRGISSQFLQQKTINDSNKCRVWWWLSLALYTKSMRTPWILDSMSSDTAFVGLGFSIDRKAQKRNQVVLGCSHLYNAQGEGLQFKLSKIENPIFRQENPFMSRDDASRVGEMIRQMFFESKSKLPNRVVIHKLSPFLEVEKEGLHEGLNGVKNIEMLEIHIDNSLRYVASVRKNDRFDDDNYPVKRGTLLKLDKYEALLWVHGTTIVNPTKNYYQGKRRIPAPLFIRRHEGQTELKVIAEEILGLSKMDWNSFDLYTRLPVTVYSSNKIAKIGKLLQRYGSKTYDYRLFI